MSLGRRPHGPRTHAQRLSHERELERKQRQTDRREQRAAHEVLGGALCSTCGYSASNVRHDTDPLDRHWAESLGDTYYHDVNLHEFTHDEPRVLDRVAAARATVHGFLRRRIVELGGTLP